MKRIKDSNNPMLTIDRKTWFIKYDILESMPSKTEGEKCRRGLPSKRKDIMVRNCTKLD